MWLLWGLGFANPIPIYSIPYSCIDPRFPTLHKGWIVGCDMSGMLAQAYHVESMQLQHIDVATEYVGLGMGLLQEKYGVWNFEEAARSFVPRITKEINAPPSGSEHGWAYTTESHLGVLQGRVSHEIEAQPRGWYPPVWWGDSVVWVEDDGKGYGDLWIYSVQEGASLLRGGELDQRYPIAMGNRLAWIEGDTIAIWLQGEHAPIIQKASVVDRLAMDENRICWAQRGEDIDIQCSDGFVLKREGHQLWPSLWNGFLLFREEGRLMLYRWEE